MLCKELISLFELGKRRWHLIGTDDCGVIAGLGLEGRLFAVMDGQVLNRVNPQAFSLNRPDGYANPGGDGLWPAPEGTTLGYEYATGQWRVPPSIVGAKFYTIDHADNSATIRAEIDLVNNAGSGIPTVFERAISLEFGKNRLDMHVEEKIQYLGTAQLSDKECLLAPWTLSQFDCGPGCEVVFPASDSDDIWDLYEPSDKQRFQANGLWHTKTDGSLRYQIGLGQEVPWIEFRDPRCNLSVRRSADSPPDDQTYVDIADAPPTQAPKDRATRFSVYSDSNGFMEIEAAGGCANTLKPATELSVTVHTSYSRPN